MFKIEAVIADWAGTTVDEGSMAPIEAFIAAFSEAGYTVTEAMVRLPMGMNKYVHVQRIAEQLEDDGIEVPQAVIDQIYEGFQVHLMATLDQFSHLKEHVLETVTLLRARGIRFGGTTGYTESMMKKLMPLVALQGYQPDFSIASDEVPKGRPYPYMIWRNMEFLGLSDPKCVVKIGDTLVDIEEAKAAGVWAVAILKGSSEAGLSPEAEASLSKEELEPFYTAARARFYEAGADFIIEDFSGLIEVIETLESQFAKRPQAKLLTPGPLTTRSRVRQAMLVDHCTWDQDYQTITRSVREQLVDLALPSRNNRLDYDSVLLQGSGTYAVEAMLVAFQPKDETLLVLNNGAYGQRMADILKAYNRPYISINDSPEQPISLSVISEVLDGHPEITGLVMVHLETTTGVLNPLESIAELVKNYRGNGRPLRFFVDAMSSFGAYPIDLEELGIDALASSANKCLEGVPGISFVIAKRSALLEISEGSGESGVFSLDLGAQYKSFKEGDKFRFTSPTHVLLALEAALEALRLEGGIEARAERYRNNWKTLVEGLSQLGFKPVVEEGSQSYVITAFDLNGYDFQRLYRLLKSNGFIIYPGKLTEKETFRVGNIGDVFAKDFKKLCEVIADVLD